MNGRRLDLRSGIVLALTVGAACGGQPPPPRSDPAVETPAWFEDVTTRAGLDFTHVNGMAGRRYLAEMMAPGVGLVDYDNDGDLDVYVVQGGTPGTEPGPPGVSDRLYRNDLETGPDGTGRLAFTDVTTASGLDVRGYGMGVAVGDIDNDGWVDLYVTQFGPNVLLRNNGDGSFTDRSRASGTDDPAWSVSAAFLDVDRDGWLDLFVGNYLRYDLESVTPCFGPSGAEDYCRPDAYPPVPDRLYRNLGNGRFEDITARAGLGRQFGPALGVATADYDGDGWVDVYVANDRAENQLWINQRDGTFRDTALFAGAALSADGRAEASMGVDAGDVDNDGDPDLVMTHFTGEGHNLYVNDGAGSFSDASDRSGLGLASLPYTGFGAAWLDVDNDGWLDVLTANGAVQVIPELFQAGDPFPLHQPNQLLRNRGDGRFEDATGEAGPALAPSEVSRGVAVGDVDNDGDTDVLLGNNNGPLRLLVNQVGNQRHWIGVRLVGGTPPRDRLGARLEIVRPGLPSLWRRVRVDGSYASANDPRVLVGLGDVVTAPTVRVSWPGGEREEWAALPVDGWATLVEGSGSPVSGE